MKTEQEIKSVGPKQVLFGVGVFGIIEAGMFFVGGIPGALVVPGILILLKVFPKQN